VELALEALARFAGAALPWIYWRPGAERALVFAAYRRRFTAEQMADWTGAEIVLPSFAALFGAQVGPATTVILTAADGLTAVHWTRTRSPRRSGFILLAPKRRSRNGSWPGMASSAGWKARK